MALNMLVSTSFPAELLLICRRESSGINRATTGEPPMLAPKELGPSHRDAPTQPSTGRESGKGKKDTAVCFQLDVLGGRQGEVSRAAPSPELQEGPLQQGDDFMAAFWSSPSILRDTLIAELLGYL